MVSKLLFCTLLSLFVAFDCFFIYLYLTDSYVCTLIMMSLVELAHWCVAGAARRQLADFGYWYAPDGRTAEQQGAFEQVEVKPQALEWLFCEAAGHPFRVSLDNLSGDATDPTPFKTRVVEQVQSYLSQGIPERPARFINALLTHYRPGDTLQAQDFSVERL